MATQHPQMLHSARILLSKRTQCCGHVKYISSVSVSLLYRRRYASRWDHPSHFIYTAYNSRAFLLFFVLQISCRKLRAMNANRNSVFFISPVMMSEFREGVVHSEELTSEKFATKRARPKFESAWRTEWVYLLLRKWRYDSINSKTDHFVDSLTDFRMAIDATQTAVGWLFERVNNRNNWKQSFSFEFE